MKSSFEFPFVRSFLSGLSLSLLCSLTALSHASAADKSQVETSVPSGLLQLGGNSQYFSPYAFVVDKKRRTLSVWQQDKTTLVKVAEYDADMGKNSGDKKSQGDHKTPEGIYFLQERLEGSTLNFDLYGQRAFTTDYPNFFDRTEGKTGNGIWLHAVPDKVPLTRGSRGCVVVRNNIIAELTQYVKLGHTPMIIHEAMEFVSQDKSREQNLKLATSLESWRTAWEKKDIESYIGFYGAKFNALNMNRDQWKTYKQGLNAKYKYLGVKLSRPVIYSYKDRAVVRFLQEYQSDQHSDFGEKTLYLAEENGQFKIIGEAWQEEKSSLAREEINATTTSAAF